jgi:hypothetical protein
MKRELNKIIKVLDEEGNARIVCNLPRVMC